MVVGGGGRGVREGRETANCLSKVSRTVVYKCSLQALMGVDTAVHDQEALTLLGQHKHSAGMHSTLLW